MNFCYVCGGTEFVRHRVLWRQLVDDWQISPDEADYIDRQQGEVCTGCGANLRSIALARCILAQFGSEHIPLKELASAAEAKEVSVLEINEAGSLTQYLSTFPNYRFAAYPEADMHALPFETGSIDLLVHSDTLEHIANPIHALAECKRVLSATGTLCFTVPIIVGRMTRDRTGLSKSFHGNPATSRDDYAVQTEFGADAWCHLMAAGFTRVEIVTFRYPCGIAIAATH